MEAIHAITMQVLDDGQRAVLHVPAERPPEELTLELLQSLAGEARIQLTDAVREKLASIIQDFHTAPRELAEEIARAEPPVDGTDGAWIWEPAFNPSANPCAITTPDAHADYFAPRIIAVESGQVVARCTPPTRGVDGRSVLGAVLRARPGRPTSFRAGSGLSIHSDGTVVAEFAGALRVTANAATVSPVLDIRGCVDFTTGHVTFAGDITVADAVRDGFHVHATGSVTVSGPVEGAQITCKGDMVCPRGVASVRRARVLVEGNATIGYMRNVDGLFKGNLACRGELEHCHISVERELHCESGRLIGGSLHLMGVAHIGIVGSQDWVPTTVSLGDLPAVAMELHRLTVEAARVHRTITPMEEAAHQIQLCGNCRLSSTRVQLAALERDISELERQAADIEMKRAPLLSMLAKGRAAELHVSGVVHPRVRIQHGRAFEFEHELAGPLQLTVDGNGDIMLRIGSQTPRPITDFAHAVRPAVITASDPEPLRKCA